MESPAARSAWDRLTRPHDGVGDLEDRLRLRILRASSLALAALILISGATMLASGVGAKPLFWLASAGLLILCGATWAIGRLARPGAGTPLFVVGGNVLLWGLVLGSAGTPFYEGMHAFLVFPVLAAAILLTPGATAVLATANVLVSLLERDPNVVDPVSNAMRSGALVAIAALLTGFSVLRQRDVNRVREQAAVLGLRERALRILNHVDELSSRAIDERIFLQQACRTIVELGGCRLAWIGVADDGPGHPVKPVASFGDDDYVAALDVTWDDAPRGQITGRAVRTGQDVVMRHIRSDPVYTPFRERALEHGFESSISIAMDFEPPRAALMVYSGRPDAFDEEEHVLLAKLAANLVFAVRALRARSEREAAQREVERTAALLEEAQAVAAVGSWELDLRTNQLWWSRENYRIFGRDPDHFGATYEAFLETIHPDDRPLVNQAFTASLANRTPYAIDHRLLLPDGAIKWVHERCQTSYDASGKAVRSVGTTQDITARKEVERRLTAAKEAAEAADRAKMTFLATMSHEIRTPLNGVLGMAELMAGTRLNDEQRSMLQTIRGSGDHLLHVLDDILEYSKIKAGGLEIHPGPTDLRKTAAQAFAIMAARAREKGIAATMDVINGFPNAVIADEQRVRQAIANLLSNAVKFTAEGSVNLRLSAEAKGKGWHVTIAVSDTGIGIAAGKIQRLFRPFSQLDEGATRVYGGSGLGLAIVQDIMGRMGGTVTVQSEVGKGSTFTLSFPAETAEMAAPNTHEHEEATEVGQVPAMRLLVAEDDPVNQRVIVGMLRRLGLQPDTVADGEAAVKAVDAKSYDVVLMDIHMPRKDGLQATKEIHLRHAAGHPRIVALTADALSEERARALRAGMDDYITKPVRLAQLADALRHAAAA